MFYKTQEITKISRGILMLLLTALSVVACQDYDNGYTEKQLSFIRDFKAIYGEVDPTQDWNLAERGSVTVTTSSPSNIKIYAKAKGKYTIVGDYQGVSGTRTLGFDVVEGTEDIIVTDGMTAEHTTCGGGSVVFAGTRGVISKEGLVSRALNDDGTNKTIELQYDELSKWQNYIPEKQFNLGKVSEDFLYISTGPFVLYPLYWQTDNYLTLGIYYHDVDGSIKYVDIYQNKANYEKNEWYYNYDPNDPNSVYSYKDAVIYKDGVTTNRTAEIEYMTEDKWLPGSNGESPYTIDKEKQTPKRIRTKGIYVNLPAGTVFGMYMKVREGYIFYSDSDRNPDPGVDYSNPSKKVIDRTISAPHAATFEDDKGNVFLGFEDWYYDPEPNATDYVYEEKYCDFDLNDCLFMFGDPSPIIVDNDASHWIISAEDLGNTYDIDYNDVVLDVSYISGQERAYVTPLAAGGTLASYAFFGDTPIGNYYIDSEGHRKTGEIHGLFGSYYTNLNKEKVSGKFTPINVRKDKPDVYSRTYTVRVPNNFSLAPYVPDAENPFNGEAQQPMGGFNIWVLDNGEEVPEDGFTKEELETLIASNKIRAQKIQNFQIIGDQISSEDNVPYVICTPKYWDRNDEGKLINAHYRWPRESKSMIKTEKYGDGAYDIDEAHSFGTWVSDKTRATDWYKYPNEDLTCAPTGINDNTQESIRPTTSPTLQFVEGLETDADTRYEMVTIDLYQNSAKNIPIDISKYIETDSPGKIRYEIISQTEDLFHKVKENGDPDPEFENQFKDNSEEAEKISVKNPHYAYNSLLNYPEKTGVATIRIIQEPYTNTGKGSSNDYTGAELILVIKVENSDPSVPRDPNLRFKAGFFTTNQDNFTVVNESNNKNVYITLASKYQYIKDIYNCYETDNMGTDVKITLTGDLQLNGTRIELTITRGGSGTVTFTQPASTYNGVRYNEESIVINVDCNQK